MTLNSELELSIVIPVFNEENGVSTLVDRISGLLRQVEDVRAEVIFVDDHSTDGSPALLKAACSQNERFCYLRLSRNSGSHVATLAGLEHSRGKCAIFLA